MGFCSVAVFRPISSVFIPAQEILSKTTFTNTKKALLRKEAGLKKGGGKVFGCYKF